MAAAPLVLLCEPPGDTSTLETVLLATGCRVVGTCAVGDTMERARREQPTAIVFRGAADVGMVLVKKLRCNARTATLPTVLVADASDAARQEFARWGVTFLLNPATGDEAVADVVRNVTPQPPPLVAPDAELARPERLRSLQRAHLMDTPPEEPFDRLARFMAQLLDVPIVLMSIVDNQRQFFKAQVGLPEPVTRQTPLTHSFCQWVVTADGEMVVEDARRHQVLSVNPATIEGGMVAYAGVPLRADADETIGSFCAVDIKPRRWDPKELRALYDAADVARGLAAVRQAARLPPVTFEEFRDTAGVAGRAVEAAMRLHEAGKTRVQTDEQQALLALVSEVGRQLAGISGRAT